jgi:dihydrofolate synthase/folylpolyglutamate synthase
MVDPVEAFLSRLHHPVLAGIDLKLERMRRFLSLLGSPHLRLPPIVHVAGTNGKGSLIAYLHAMYEKAGLRVHRYTSPHLIEFRERILLQGKPIEPAYLQTLLKHVAAMLPQQPATFFEATTALAFLAFAESKADLLLMETGMGGRLDSTNVIDKPLLTAITPISLDHCEYLGNTIEKIAQEKAGIMKPGIACVVGRQVAEAAAVLERTAGEIGAPLYRMGQEWQLEGNRYRSDKRTLTLTPALAGAHQFDNAATAVACADMLPFPISDAQISEGLASAVWPARLQKLDRGNYAKLLPPGIELWLDGGHNPQGGAVLAEWLASCGAAEVYLICGMMKGKDTAGYLKPLQPAVTGLYGIPIPGEALAQPGEQVQMAAAGIGIPSQAAASVENALQTIAQRAKTPAIVCICGSLYLAGKVLAADQRG